MNNEMKVYSQMDGASSKAAHRIRFTAVDPCGYLLRGAIVADRPKLSTPDEPFLIDFSLL